MSRRIEVVLLPTSECPKLVSIADALSQVQNIFNFTVIGEFKSESRIIIDKVTPLKKEGSPDLPFHESRVLRAYIGTADWPTQIVRFIKENGGADSDFEHTNTFAVCVGSGTYIDEQVTDHFYFTSDDSYTSLYEFSSDKNPTSNENISSATWKVGIISLIQFESIFQIRPNMIGSDKGRADFGRYIVMNLVHFLGSRSFWNKLARDHLVKNCVMETSWSDADYLRSYYTRGLCHDCKTLVNSHPKNEQLSKLFSQFNTLQVFSSIEKMCELPKKWDNILKMILLSRTAAASFLGVFGVGLFANILASVEYIDSSASLFSQTQGNFGKHPLPLIVCVASVLLSALAYGIGSLLKRFALP